MIKLCEFNFVEVQTDNHWIAFPTFGPVTKSVVHWYDGAADLDISLSPDKVYQIGMDQSTSCCGIFIKDYANTEAYMIEYKGKPGDADNTIFDIEMFLHKLCGRTKISHLIYERPISTEAFRSAQVLFQLEGMIRALNKRYDEFKPALLEYIENSSWRRAVILDKCKDYANRKMATQDSIQAIFDFSHFYDQSLGKDCDVYEAMGVMFGWFFNSYDALGRPYVRGDQYSGAIGGFILPDVSAEDVCAQFKEAGFDTAWAMQNPRKSTFENLASAVQKHKVICVEFTDLYSMLTLFVECNLKWTEPEKLTVVLTAANYVDFRLFDITGKKYHFVV